MAKEKVRKMTGVFTSIFAHTGHISKDEAKEISGLDDEAFDKAYSEASSIADKFMDAEGESMGKLIDSEGKKMDKFMEHFGAKIEEYLKGYRW